MRIGILGSGQLSRMLALSGIPMGFNFVFYADKPSSDMNHLGEVIYGKYTDNESLERFARKCDVITYENENIPFESVQFLEMLKPVYPNAKALAVTQDRILEKNLFDRLEIPTTKYRSIDSIKEALKFAQDFGYPFILKKRRNGYDGKGLIKIISDGQLLSMDENYFKDCIAESFVNFEREVSMISVRSTLGQQVYYDVCQNQHHNGILIKTGNIINDPMFELAKAYIDSVISALEYVGCIAFEFFQVGDTLLANELAPRVHNSGHWTIEGAYTSQFQNHIRAICGLPLGNTSSIHPTTMINIIGKMIDKNEVLNNDFYYIHDYHKEPKQGRKLGHITMINVIQ